MAHVKINILVSRHTLLGESFDVSEIECTHDGITIHSVASHLSGYSKWDLQAYNLMMNYY